jgi:hypothetical protein
MQITSIVALAVGLFVSNVAATVDLGDTLNNNCMLTRDSTSET